MSLFKRLEAYVLSAERLHRACSGKGKTDTGRISVYVRDEKPIGGPRQRERYSIARANGPARIPRST